MATNLNGMTAESIAFLIKIGQIDPQTKEQTKTKEAEE